MPSLVSPQRRRRVVSPGRCVATSEWNSRVMRQPAAGQGSDRPIDARSNNSGLVPCLEACGHRRGLRQVGTLTKKLTDTDSWHILSLAAAPLIMAANADPTAVLAQAIEPSPHFPARPSANALNFARSPGASMQIHFKFRCRFTMRCNTISRNYMRITAIILVNTVL